VERSQFLILVALFSPTRHTHCPFHWLGGESHSHLQTLLLQLLLLLLLLVLSNNTTRTTSAVMRVSGSPSVCQAFKEASILV
jgi:hypothetical protein